jgi:hypothetical protein
MPMLLEVHHGGHSVTIVDVQPKLPVGFQRSVYSLQDTGMGAVIPVKQAVVYIEHNIELIDELELTHVAVNPSHFGLLVIRSAPSVLQSFDRKIQGCDRIESAFRQLERVTTVTASEIQHRLRRLQLEHLGYQIAFGAGHGRIEQQSLSFEILLPKC